MTPTLQPTARYHGARLPVPDFPSLSDSEYLISSFKFVPPHCGRGLGTHSIELPKLSGAACRVIMARTCPGALRHSQLAPCSFQYFQYTTGFLN
jgi:hypothetical protein